MDSPMTRRKASGEAGSILHRFLVRLQTIKVLDATCGSGLHCVAGALSGKMSTNAQPA